MKIIHCSDIHLDSALDSNLSDAQARERRAELCAAFGRMIRYARDEGVAAVLISGDLFDVSRASCRTAEFVLDQIGSAPEISFLYLRGNHDCADPFRGMELPENLLTFGREWTYYHFGDVTVAGAEPVDWVHFYEDLKLAPGRTNIVMLHGQVSGQPGEELIALPSLRRRNIDYLALGHIHGFRQEKLDEDGIWCYSGCLEGRGFDECGQKGFVLLDTEGGRVKSEFISFASRALYDIPVDITDLVTVSQISRAMEDAAGGISGDSLVKFTLTGTYTPDTQKDLTFLRKTLQNNFWFVKIKDDSRFLINKEDYENDISLKGEFIRMVMASDKSEEEKARIICCGIQALRGEEVVL